MKALHAVLSVLVLSLVLSCSSSSSPSEQLNSYLDAVEQECASYTYSDWERMEVEFEEMLADIEENYDDMTPEERAEVMKAVGRYCGMAAKKGIQETATEIQKILDGLPSFIEGFSEMFK